jgi:hypothetical protein
VLAAIGALALSGQAHGENVARDAFASVAHDPPASDGKPNDRARADAPADRTPTQDAPAGGSRPASPPGASTEGDQPAAATETFALRSPLCDATLAAGLDADQRRACRATGSPAGAIPVDHYAFDISWDPAITQPAKVAIKAFYELLDMLWLGLLFCLRGLLAILDWAFALNPFDAAGGGLARALARFFSVIDAGFFTALIAAVGLGAIWSGLVRRRTASAIGSLALAVAMLVVALAVIRAPDATTGALARWSNHAAMGLMAAPSQGLDARPVATYAQAMSRLFEQLAGRPWCALDFRGQEFCSGRAEAGAVKAATGAGDDGPSERELRGASRAALWLSYAPDSKPRRALHDFYAGRDAGKIGVLGVNLINTPIGDRQGKDPDQVAIQGPSGALTRLPLLLLISAGLLGALCVLAWIALRLLAQATLGFVLLLAAPLAFLFPALGESGRRAFTRWALALLGALVSKVVYAALLGVLLLAAGLLADAAGHGNWLLGWLLTSGLWWAVFLKRSELLALVSVQPVADAGPGGGMRQLRGVAHGMTHATTDALQNARAQRFRVRNARSEAVRHGAREALDDRASQRDRHARAHSGELIDRDRELRGELAALEASPDLHSARLKTADTDHNEPPALTAQERHALDDHARLSAEHERLAPRVADARASLAPPGPEHATPRALRALRRERLAAELALPVSDPIHAWRVGMRPADLQALARTDPHRHGDHLREIAAQLERDRALARALPDEPRTPPQPMVERPAARALDRQRYHALRREHAARLRHERQTRRYLAR